MPDDPRHFEATLDNLRAAERESITPACGK